MTVPIEQYGLVGDTRTAALVAPDGAIDWLCVPFFDGEPVFGRLLGGPSAGTFRMGPKGVGPKGAGPDGVGPGGAGPEGVGAEGWATVTSRRYRPATATLETSWDGPQGRLTLTEAMIAEVAGRLLPTTLLVRRLTATGGDVTATIDFDPRLGERHRRPVAERRGDVLCCRWPRIAMALHVSPALPIEAGKPITVVVSPGRPVTIAVCVAEREPLIHVPPEVAWRALEEDERRWHDWCGDISADVPRRDAVLRSLLTLQLLTFSPSGAPVAAATTSLPEELGGVRNWDYRYAWPRDASIGIGAFLGVGKGEEARRFMAWLLSATRLTRPRLPVLLNLHGRTPAPERELVGWPGYADSVPVRVGNGAAHQRQLDGYGWVLDAAWLMTRSGWSLYAETWRVMAAFADTIAACWREKDSGIWEVRGEQAHHVHSKLMSWLALDRALRISEVRRTSAKRRARWAAQRDALAEDIRSRGFDPERETYTRSYGSSDVDAAVLYPLTEIEPPGSPRVAGTIDAVRRTLGAGGPLIYRYPPGKEDGLPGGEGAFVACSFWLVHALARTGRRHEALELFDELVDLSAPLGLLAEQVDPETMHALGNFPQALSHATLVQAALALRDASRGASDP